ncbi:hypothetical protein GCM10027040_27270 [Halomonas shantousis]
MQCECRSRIEEKLRAKVMEQLPEGARDFVGTLEGYAFIMTDNMGLGMQPVMPFKVEYEAPKKRGDGFTKKKQTVNITANYCPFCGKAAKSPEGEVAA